jgi:hypothetical protein
MNIQEIYEIMEDLSKNRPVFVSEDDFKLALFSEIAFQKKSYKNIRLEKMFANDIKNGDIKLYKSQKDIYLDGFIQDKKIGFELKYKQKL